MDKSSCLNFKYRVCIWHRISYLGLKKCKDSPRDHARFSRSRLALCVNTDKIFLGEEVMKIWVIQVDS